MQYLAVSFLVIFGIALAIAAFKHEDEVKRFSSWTVILLVFSLGSCATGLAIFNK